MTDTSTAVLVTANPRIRCYPGRYVAFIDGIDVGYLTYDADPTAEDTETGLPLVTMQLIDVDLPWRRKGIATALFTALRSDFPDHAWTLASTYRTWDGAQFAKAVGLEDTGYSQHLVDGHPSTPPT